MDQSVKLNTKLNTVTMLALANAERERRERYAKQMDETKNILTDFIQRIGQENNLQIPESVKTKLNLVEVARYAIELSNLIMIRQRNKLTEFAAYSDQDQIDKLIKQLEQENALLKAKLLEAAHSVSPVHDRQVQVLPATVDAVTNDTIVFNGALEENIIHVAGVIQSIHLGGLIAACEENLGLPRPEIETAIESLVKRSLIELISPTRAPRHGQEYQPVFNLTSQGLNMFSRAAGKPAIQNAARLSETGRMWGEEVPLFAHVIEEILPRHGYRFASYLPQVNVLDNNQNLHHFLPDAHVVNNRSQPAYIMYIGDRYEKGAASSYLNDFVQADNGHMYFLAINPRTARQIISDVNFMMRGKNKTFHPHATNLDDLVQYDRDLAAGEASRVDIWFVALQKGGGR